jgi:hypothetical protein
MGMTSSPWRLPHTTQIDATTKQDDNNRLTIISIMDDPELAHVEDIVAVMRLQESSDYLRSDFLEMNALSNVLDAAWRQRIIEWMYGVVDHCQLKRDCVAHAAYYLDLVTERGLITSRSDYQLAAMTALLISIKMVDSTVVKLQSMVVLGRGIFTEDDVISMEKEMLCTLKWRVHPPTPVCFLRQFLRLLPPAVSSTTRYVIAEVTRFISEISVCLYKFVKFPPSVVAYAGMLIAMERIDEVTLSMLQRHAIFSSMTRYAGLDHLSSVVVDVIRHLRMSLEKNVSLNELLETIDAQCHATQGKPLPYRHGLDGCMNSPRDVVTERDQ